ncbi:Cytochrome b5-like Heme/Steroid binding domain containing protein [Tritrichomonas foetus]|uniref:Cytochrome b5-like Heme/Steroid binding domain containing protein n=1 Tax=Tritrichomonas foetus TaxID=1144522 RepID=A0A1J4JGL3_9EUKA|nr:Cytochrome b5-like Heme/Steroid binding domain containing protein [Tritrichomonas foetus]|eukprot:OHS98296.1 Cytochrome b5-like Heme/Steroid binding domain containing protein [Tritrichomonas foetus]
MEPKYMETPPEMKKFMEQAKQCEWVGDITPLELAQHQTKDDLWVALDGEVYNITQFLPFHPTGDSCFVNAQHHDITMGYMRAHPYIDPAIVAKCKIGKLVVAH